MTLTPAESAGEVKDGTDEAFTPSIHHSGVALSNDAGVASKSMLSVDKNTLPDAGFVIEGSA
jgi:hypothetical protein